ncbi:MAG: hypothetical protein WBP29_12015 [Candidatus Zixiibacteriota bacterium]
MTPTERNNRNQLAAVILITVTARILAYLATGYQVDDALITFRYAENVAAGNGFVYNLGESVLGTSSPLFTLILAAFARMGISPPVASIIFSIFCASSAAFVLVRFAQSVGLSRFVLLPALFYAVYPRCIISDICGLETALFTFLFALSLYQLHRRDHLASSIVASFACLARPEGAGLLLVVLFICVIDRAPQLWRVLIAPAILVGGWMIFSAQYFGSVIPNSMIAKSALYENTVPFFTRLGQMTTLGAWPGSIAIAMLILLTVLFALRRNRLVITAITTLGLITGLALFSSRVFFWYAAPALPPLFLVFTKSLELAIGKRLTTKTVHILSSIIVLALGAISFNHVARLIGEMTWYTENHIAAAAFLNIHASDNDTVLAEDIGHFGYNYRGRIIDRDGLVSPQAIDYNRRRAYLQFADSVNANWLFVAAATGPGWLQIINSPDFLKRYELIPFNPAAHSQTHHLYRRL